MTISNTTNSVREAGNGSRTDFDFAFPIYNATDLKVYKINLDTEVRTLLVLNTDYTVEISTSAEGGTVTYTVAPTADEDSFIERDQPYVQSTDIPAVGGVREVQLEKALDKLCILILQLLKKTQLALKFVSSSSQVDVEVPEPEAGKVLMWNSAEDALENSALEYTAGSFPGNFSAGADASKAASPSANDLYIATDTGRVYACYTAGTWVDITGLSAAVDIASATTTNIGAIVGQYVRVTGTTTITGLGTAAAGTLKYVRFAGALTLTHNATSLILPGAASITTAAGDIAVMVSEGSGNWRCLHYQKASGLAVAVAAVATDPFSGLLLHVQDQKAANTAGGGFTTGAWRTRDLNTVLTNEISGASLGSNQITLPAGTYYISAYATGQAVNAHKAKLRNTTDGSDILIGSSAYTNAGVAFSTVSLVEGRFTLAAQKVLELQHACSNTKATDGFGLASNLGVVEVYSEVKIWKVA